MSISAKGLVREIGTVCIITSSGFRLTKSRLADPDRCDNIAIQRRKIPGYGTIAMNPHLAMTTLVEVARAGSFSAAARKLNMSTTAASRHVAELERTLGVALLRRTTRQVRVTDVGARYLPRAAAILDEIERLNAETRAVDPKPRGKLRVTAPPAVGNAVIAPLMIDFLEAYPAIALELDLTERLVDLVAEGFDAAIRAGPLESSSMIAHRIVELRYVVCASAPYLERHGAPGRPEDLHGHDCIHWRAASERGVWTFVKDGARVAVPVRERLLVSSFAAEREAVLRGLGLAILPLLVVREDLELGRLIVVLPDYEIPQGALHLLRLPTPFEPPKLRAFVDFITAALRERSRYDPVPRAPAAPSNRPQPPVDASSDSRRVRGRSPS